MIDMQERKTEKIYMRLRPSTYMLLKDFIAEMNKGRKEKYTYDDFVREAIECLKMKKLGIVPGHSLY